MRTVNLRVPILLATVLLAVGLGFFAALGVRSALGGPGHAPAAAPPNPGHSYDQVELPVGTWPNLDADKLDGMHTGQSGTDYVCYADASGNVGIGTTSPETRLHVSGTVKAESTDARAVEGFTTSANEWVPAVYGRNEGAGDGVYGWSQNRAGVWGTSTSGVGVEGQSSGNHGVEGVTSSGNSMDAGVYGENTGAGPAIRSQGNLDITGDHDLNIRDGGDLYVTGSYYGNLPNGGAPFPRPAWDSGWIGIDPGTWIVHDHNIGLDPNNYVVDFQCRYPADNTWGIHTKGLGGDRDDYVVLHEIIGDDYHYASDYYGAFYRELKSNTITVERGADDERCPQHRVRIWVIRY